MKKLAILFASMFIMAIAVQNVNAQDDASAATSANIIQPIAINKTVDLNFGNIVALATEETVTVAPNGTRSSSNPLSLPTATPGTITAASFDVTGLALATYSIVVTNASFTVTGAGDPMTVNAIVTSPTPSGTLDASGEETITVGATLTVNGGQAAGLYTNAASLELTVAYN